MSSEIKRYVIQARLLGLDKNATKRGRENEYAIDVVLSDESQYTMFRTLKEIANFHTKIMNKFKVESGYFKKEERVIPECPIKQTIFGPQRAIRDDKSFSRLLHYYLKEIPALPAAVVKSDLVTNFFSLKATDLDAPDLPENKPEKKKSRGKVELTDDSLISGPLSLKSYYTVADYTDKKTKFSFKEGATVQVIQKDPSGWWRVDAQGLIGWAPASYLVPVNENDLQEEAEENENLIEQERVGTRYISISAYQASRDDELSFVRGAVVKVLKKYVDGWWLVRYNGGEGFVPGAMFRKFDKRQATLYVKKIKRNFSSRGTTRIVPTVKPQWMNSRYQRNKLTERSLLADSRNVSAAPAVKQSREEKTVQIIVPDTTKSPALRESGTQEKEPVTVSHNGQSAVNRQTSEDTVNGKATPTADRQIFLCQARYEENGISIAENDKVEVIDDSDNDWWYVTDAKGAQGWAPANFLRPNDNKDKINKRNLESRSDSGLSLNSNVVASEMLDDEDEMDDMDNDSLDIEECYVVIKDFTKGAIDELDVFEGQVVCVIDDSDKDLWYVNADGKEGWVPSNILRLMVDEDVESSRESTPMEVPSAGASADNSEVSDDEIAPGGLKRRSRVKRIPDDKLSPAPRPRSWVIHRDSSPVHNSPVIEHRKLSSPHKLHLSDGSDSDVVNNDITIMVGDTSIAELEKAARQAERQAREAKLRAEALKEQIRVARQKSNS